MATDFELGAGPTWTIPLQQGIAFGKASSVATTASGAATPDGNGYQQSAIGGAPITATSGGVDRASGQDDGYQLATAFFVGERTSSSAPLGMLVCNDAAPAKLHLSVCNLNTAAWTFHPMRFVNLTSNPWATDACLGMGWGNSRSEGILASAGMSQGLDYLQMSSVVVSYPDGTPFEAGFQEFGGDCSNPLSAIGWGSLSADLTIAFITNPGDGVSPETVNAATLNTSSGTSTILVANDNPAYAGVSNASIDVTATQGVGAPQSVGSQVEGWGDMASTSLTPGTYTFAVTNHADDTLLASATNVTLVGGTNVVLHFYADGDAGAMAFCELSESDAGLGAASVTTCTTYP
jgi:hypothetical protein